MKSLLTSGYHGRYPSTGTVLYVIIFSLSISFLNDPIRCRLTSVAGLIDEFVAACNYCESGTTVRTNKRISQ